MSGPEQSSWVTLTPARIALAYVAVSGVWILFSDRLVDALVMSPRLEVWLQTAKGWAFVVLWAGLIYWLSRRRHLRAVTVSCLRG